MKIVGLISGKKKNFFEIKQFAGGKDSCYNLVKCVQHGHEIICLANLAPKEKQQYELDSYMFQTIGHNLIHAISDCFELPLIQHFFEGKSTQRELGYNNEKINSEDEVEDLYNLLKKVKEDFPEVEGISCGTILSDYQRNRVENVCARLNLISFTYLWQKDQSELLNEMVENGMDSILVKVASMGLSPKKHLGKSLKDLQNIFEKLKIDACLNVCGEGGEYETITLDCPLFKKRIVIDESEIKIENDDYYAPVAYFIINKFHLEKKNELMDLEMINENQKLEVSSVFQFQQKEKKKLENNDKNIILNIKKTKNFISISGESFDSSLNSTLFSKIEDATQDFKILQNVLILQNLKHFNDMNKTYLQFFKFFDPPSRVCIENSNMKSSLKIECFGITREEELHSKVLHVQSISEWAPANIGPYSQAIQFGNLIKVSGQIGLIPTLMKLEDDYIKEFNTTIKNLNSILSYFQSSLENSFRIIIFVDQEKINQEFYFKKELLKRVKFNEEKLFLEIITTSKLPRNAALEFHVFSVRNFEEISVAENFGLNIFQINQQFKLSQTRNIEKFKKNLKDILKENEILIIRIFSKETETELIAFLEELNLITFSYLTDDNNTLLEIEFEEKE
eukprot:gene7136-11449_t